MPSTSETGHAKNISNFASLISFCKGYGAKFNPSRVALQTANLDAQHDAAAAALDDVKHKRILLTLLPTQEKIYSSL